jgi:hypothetical protein
LPSRYGAFLTDFAQLNSQANSTKNALQNDK